MYPHFHPLAINKNALTRINGLAENAQAGHVYLLSGERRLVGNMAQELVNRLALRGEVYVIVGGNRISLERLPLLLQHQPRLLEQATQRIRVTRAETCYQLLDAFEHTSPSQCPLVVTDLLHTLSDEDVQDVEAERLLAACLRHLSRLSQFEPVLVSAAYSSEKPRLLEILQAQVSDEIRFLPPRLAEPDQPSLFPEL